MISFSIAFMFWKFGTAKFHIKNFSYISLFALIILLPSFFYFQQKKESFSSNSKNLEIAMLQSFDSNPNLGTPATDSPFRLATANADFKSAPIQLTIFSDFQCPACKMLSDVLHEVMARFEGKINAQYFFYPLDMNARFGGLHDALFAAQDNLSKNFIKELAESEKVTQCYTDPATKEKIQAMIKEATPFNIRSTPTMILNGVKIEGVLPRNQMMALIEGLLKRIEKK
jgi:protein-disulfide isomerase